MEGALAQHTRELAAREAALNDALAQLGERERQLGGALGQLEEVAAANDRLSQVSRDGVSPCWCAGSCAQRILWCRDDGRMEVASIAMPLHTRHLEMVLHPCLASVRRICLHLLT